MAFDLDRVSLISDNICLGQFIPKTLFFSNHLNDLVGQDLRQFEIAKYRLGRFQLLD